MANYVEYSARPDLSGVQMSNGVTSVFIGVLAIATSKLAGSAAQKRLAVWIAARDQSVRGLGCVGFDVAELPWNAETFTDDKEFLIAATVAAQNRLGWDALGDAPDAAVIIAKLQELERLLEQLNEVDLRPSEPDDAEMFTRCREHGIYLHDAGCVICNDS